MKRQTATAASTQLVYDNHAAAFDRRRDKSLFEKNWLDRFTASIPKNGHILDVGCGSGDPIAAYLMSQDFRVTGIDASPAMIDLARSNFPTGDWHIQDMRSIDQRASFDGIIAWNSFFHLTQSDQRAVLPVLASLLKPGAPLMLTTGTDDGIAFGEVAGQPVFHASLSTETYRTILSDHGCKVLKATLSDPDCRQHSVLLAQKHSD